MGNTCGSKSHQVVDASALGNQKQADVNAVKGQQPSVSMSPQIDAKNPSSPPFVSKHSRRVQDCPSNHAKTNVSVPVAPSAVGNKSLANENGKDGDDDPKKSALLLPPTGVLFGPPTRGSDDMPLPSRKPALDPWAAYDDDEDLRSVLSSLAAKAIIANFSTVSATALVTRPADHASAQAQAQAAAPAKKMPAKTSLSTMLTAAVTLQST